MRLKHLVEARRYREAVESYRACEAPDQRMDPENRWLAANAAARTGDLIQSRELALAAFEQFASAGQHSGLMQVTNLLGIIAFERGQIMQARGYLSQVLHIHAGAGISLTSAPHGSVPRGPADTRPGQ
jgi:hypothetical protein